jgi:hypothetical protein
MPAKVLSAALVFSSLLAASLYSQIWMATRNHPNFGKPDTNINAGSGGRIRSTATAARALPGAFKLYF